MKAKPPFGLGIDAGGTRTRWALAAGDGEIVAEGHVSGMTALHMMDARRESVAATLAQLAVDVLALAKPDRVHAGITGYGEGSERLADLVATPLGLPASAVSLGSDIETAYRDLYAPGEGYVVYAGTGSVAAFIDAEGALHRAGGRGVTLDDGGGGFWIAREALRHVWRAEDERPGSWHDSPMAKALFERIGGADWSFTRQYVYGGDRGDIGRLALAVAESAERDPAARAILAQAGRELARLAVALTGRYGPRPVTLSGRAASLHPLIAQTMRAALPADCAFAVRPCHGHHAAARLALRAATARFRGPPMPRILCCFLLALVAGCATGLRIDDSYRAKSQDSRAQYLIIHFTTGNFAGAFNILTEGPVSSHYLVSDDDPPRIYRLVDENRRAYHAGVSSWKGQTALNAASIGIEIVNAGDVRTNGEIAYADYPKPQIDAVIALVKDIVARHEIRGDRILGHSDIAPLRKVDPGPKFPWKRLADEGLIPWPDAKRVAERQSAYEQALPDIVWFQRKLAEHGFAIAPNGEYDEATIRVIAAFQMKYRPARYDGQPDAETAAILDVMTSSPADAP